MTDQTIGILLFKNFQLLDAAGPASVFEVASELSGRSMTVKPLAIGAGPVRSSCGVEMIACDASIVDKMDTFIVVGGAGVTDVIRSEAAIAWVKFAACRARRMASICSGALILAQAGLLDGRRATTHWKRSKMFQATYPRVRVQPDEIFVKDGNIWTSAGICAGIDLALAMVSEDLGDEIAKATARHLVVYHRRSGGQSQFSTLLELKSSSGRFGPLLDWVRGHLGEELSVERMADRVHMSARHFTRTFTAETGMSPAKAVERLRLEIAKAHVEADAEPFDRVARATGFNDAERMRRAFLREFGHPPQSLRRVARSNVEPGVQQRAKMQSEHPGAAS